VTIGLRHAHQPAFTLPVELQPHRNEPGRDTCRPTWDLASMRTWRSSDTGVITVSVHNPTSYEATVLLRANNA